MKKELVKKTSKLLTEIEELEKYKNLVKNKKHGEVVNFVIQQHYGSTYENERVLIPLRYTKRLLNVVDEIIEEMNTELEKL